MIKFQDELGNLADPCFYTDPVSLENVHTDQLIAFYQSMFKIRCAEEAIANLSFNKETGTPVHLAIGQEAIAVGIAANLCSLDKVYSGHRGHAHYLSLGAPLFELFAEVLGRSDGASRGMGGSMHLFAPDFGFHGSVPIVGATIPIAVGAALACKMDGLGSVAVVFFGDGACEEGVLHESLNLAITMNLPIIFVCENNLYSSHLDIHLRQPSNRVARFAEAHKINSCVVDGNDVVAMQSVSRDAISNAQEGNGPSFIEAVTYRWRGHVGPNIDIDVGVRRSLSELEAWKKRDPLIRLQASLESERAVSSDTFSKIKKSVELEISAALIKARKSPYPDPSCLLDFVYSGVS